MTFREALHFSYAGIKSDDMGLINVSTSNGLYEEPFVAEKSILETSVRGREKAYFQGLEYRPLQFSLSFAFEDTWDDVKIREIARWLGGQKYYQPLYFTTDINRIYYVLFVDGIEIIHNGLKQGYVNLTARCDSPYSYTPTYQKIFNLSNNPSGGTEIEILNYGDLECYPTLTILTKAAGSVSIKNLSDNGREMSFSNLESNETLTIDCEHEDIETDIPLTYRYSNMSGKFLRLVRGTNRLLVTGKVELKFVYQSPLL